MWKAFFHTFVSNIRKSDRVFWLLTTAATVYGCLLIASQERNGGSGFLKTQVIAAVVGLVAAFVISLTDFREIAGLWKWVAGIALMLTFAVFFAGIRVSGTDDVGWLRLPWGLTFQPSELTKVCFILTFSKHLSYLEKTERLKRFSGVMALTLHAMIPIGLIHMQGDDGAALIFGCMALAMMFAGGVPLRYFMILTLCVVPAVPFVWLRVMNDDQKNRLVSLFSTDDSMLKTYGWQQYQGKISVASGGIFGKGLFQGSRTGAGIVPYQENDFIFTAAGEESGLVGGLAVILLFAWMLIRLLKNAYSADSLLGKSICIGCFALIGTQVFVNLGMVLGLLPVVGITLPFFSAGGTSVACLYLSVGLAQSVYMHPDDPSEKPVHVNTSSLVG